jgi:Domain of unknown function (DUF5664)
MICSLCLNRPCDDGDSIGSRQGLCQDCWEAACSASWWDAVAAIPTLEELTLMTEHDLPRLYDPEASDQNPKDRASAHKPPLHLIPPSAEILEAVVMGLGARKYGPFNWRTAPIRATVYIAAAKRHLAQWLDGQNDDPESGVSHLAHARACLGILLDAQSLSKIVDDRPPPGAAHQLIISATKSQEQVTL